MARRIYYRKGYKYQLAEQHVQLISLKGYNVNHEFFELRDNGILIVHKGYAWDGPSGPTIDTATFMRGSLIHDVLCQSIALGLIPESEQEAADKILKNICLADGMSPFRAWYVYAAVRFYYKNGGKSEARPIEIAP